MNDAGLPGQAGHERETALLRCFYGSPSKDQRAGCVHSPCACGSRDGASGHEESARSPQEGAASQQRGHRGGKPHGACWNRAFDHATGSIVETPIAVPVGNARARGLDDAAFVIEKHGSVLVMPQRDTVAFDFKDP